MDIKIPHSFLSTILKTNAKPEKIAELLSLSGPSVEKVEKVGNDHVYSIEITTNRVDTASVLGIAKEANTILNHNKIKSHLVLPKELNIKKSNQNYIEIIAPKNIAKRVLALKIENIDQKAKSPLWLKNSLEYSGVRSLNLVVDITNYIMLEIGHPTHVFDLDKLEDKYLKFVEIKNKKEFIGLDNKKYILPKESIVIVNKKNEIIDLPGIIGAKNTSVTDSSKNILFFIDNIDPIKLRKTSLKIGVRTNAAILNEKSVDENLGLIALKRGAFLYSTLVKGKVGEYIDIKNTKDNKKEISFKLNDIENILGIYLNNNEVQEILTNLGFSVKIKKDIFEVGIPSYRSNDISIKEDIAEEIARIIGYQNIKGKIMAGEIPLDKPDNIFDFETKIKNILVALGAIEVLNNSLTSKELAVNKNEEYLVEIINPLNKDSKYLKTTLKKDLINNLNKNKSEKNISLHLFEMSNVYLKNKSNLPKEVLKLAGVIKGTNLRHAKGIVETLIDSLHLKPFEYIFEKISDEIYYYEFDVFQMFKSQGAISYKPIPKYPPQIEDLTIQVNQNILVGDIIKEILKINQVDSVEYLNSFNDSHSFRLYYLDNTKTLNNVEIARIRNQIIKNLKEKFGAIIK